MAVGIDIGTSEIKVVCDGNSRPITNALAALRNHRSDILDRMGDHVPLVTIEENGTVTSQFAHETFADIVHEVIGRVSEDRGQFSSQPFDQTFALTVPSWWTARATRLVEAALHGAEVQNFSLVNEAIAAAQGYEDGPIPSTVAVLDLGSHTCCVTVLGGCDTEEPRLLGQPGVLHDAGGTELNSIVLHHLLKERQQSTTPLEANDSNTVAAAVKFLDKCRVVKEALSEESVVTIDASFAAIHPDVRMVRSEFEELARPWALKMVDLVRDAVHSSESDVGTVLLVGGSARIPLVTELLIAHLGVDVLIDAEPETTTARGAARSARVADSEAESSIDVPLNNSAPTQDRKKKRHSRIPDPSVRHRVEADTRSTGEPHDPAESFGANLMPAPTGHRSDARSRSYRPVAAAACLLLLAATMVSSEEASAPRFSRVDTLRPRLPGIAAPVANSPTDPAISFSSLRTSDQATTPMWNFTHATFFADVNDSRDG